MAIQVALLDRRTSSVSRFAMPINKEDVWQLDATARPEMRLPVAKRHTPPAAMHQHRKVITSTIYEAARTGVAP